MVKTVCYEARIVVFEAFYENDDHKHGIKRLQYAFSILSSNKIGPLRGILYFEVKKRSCASRGDRTCQLTFNTDRVLNAFPRLNDRIQGGTDRGHGRFGTDHEA